MSTPVAAPSAFQAMQDAREPLSYEDHSNFTHQLLGWFLGAIDTKGVLTKEDAMRAISQVREYFLPAGDTASHAAKAGRPS